MPFELIYEVSLFGISVSLQAGEVRSQVNIVRVCLLLFHFEKRFQQMFAVRFDIFLGNEPVAVESEVQCKILQFFGGMVLDRRYGKYEMAITVAGQLFDGPYDYASDLRDEAGVFLVFDEDNTGRLTLLDVDEAV